MNQRRGDNKHHDNDALGHFIALAYDQNPHRIPAHCKPPYDKSKFARGPDCDDRKYNGQNARKQPAEPVAVPRKRPVLFILSPA